jgi:hypothetical protein
MEYRETTQHCKTRGLLLSHTKKASPMIQEGDPVPVLASKNAPMHSVELVCVKAKSAGLIDHVAPPNENSTFTVVEHAD